MYHECVIIFERGTMIDYKEGQDVQETAHLRLDQIASECNEHDMRVLLATLSLVLREHCEGGFSEISLNIHAGNLTHMTLSRK